MIEIFLWSIMAYGLTNILVFGSIFDKVRNMIVSNSVFFGKLVTCVLCTSTWVGFTFSVIFGGLTNKFITYPVDHVHILFDGFFIAGIVWIINSIVEFFEEYR